MPIQTVATGSFRGAKIQQVKPSTQTRLYPRAPNLLVPTSIRSTRIPVVCTQSVTANSYLAAYAMDRTIFATITPLSYCGSGIVSRIPPITSCGLKSFFGLLGWALWQPIQD